MSEIDDIFAKRPVASTSAVAAPIKKKKKEKRAAEKQGAETDTASSSCKKRPAPETVIDPSTTRPPPLKKPKVDKAPAPSTDDTERFKDSRGSGPRRFVPLLLDYFNISSQDARRKKGGPSTRRPNWGSAMRVETRRCALLIVIAVSNIFAIRL
ncbi:hypothetical protein C8J57DRAFT_24630 [Mycena rebaudengoi]|nr:hypothetical protein C8J57DRAFT_24630 [Mycena rebaudengoi]